MRTILQRLSAVIILALLSILTVAAEEVTVDSLKYKLNSTDHTASVSGSDNNIRVAHIPQTIKSDGVEYKVTSLGRSCFYNCSVLISVTIPEGVKTLEEQCFRGCIGLTSIKIPQSVTSLGQSCFSNCSSLSSISIPQSVKSIGTWCFSDCSSLTNIIIPQSVTSLGQGCFWNCSSLTNVTIPDGVTKLDGGCFLGCSNLTSVTISKSVTSMGRGCFENCSKLTDINIPEGVTSLEEETFYNCSSLANITIPETVKSFGKGCFRNCSSLASITIPQSVTSIGDECFQGCSNLTSINIPHSVTSLGSGCFSGCSNLTGITIPQSVTSLGYGCFYFCSGLINITIPNSVTSIGDECFHGCDNLKNIVISESVSSLGSYCFYYCRSLSSITIPKSVKSLGEFCFKECTNLASVKILDGTTSLGKACFNQCYNLTNITIPETVTSLGDDCFSGCSRLNNVIIPQSVTSLGSGCFYGCSLTNITIPKYISKLPDDCFMGCKDLESVIIPESVTSIGHYCFSGCGKLQNLICLAPIPPSCESNTFDRVDGSKCVVLVKNVDAYKKVDNWNNFWNIYPYGIIITTIDGLKYALNNDTKEALFISCNYNHNIVVPEKVSYNNTEFKVTALGSHSFYFWTTLASLTLPATITSIGEKCFNNVGADIPCKLLISNDFDTKLLGTPGTYYSIAGGRFVVPVQQIDLSAHEIDVVNYRKFQQIKATVSPAAANNKAIKVTSGNTSIASIVNNDSIVINNLGETDIRYEASDGYGANAICHVKSEASTDSIKIDNKSQSLIQGQTFTPSFILYPEDAIRIFKVSSSDRKVATVDSTGAITAVGLGEAEIRFEANDNSEAFATLHVKVYAPTESIALSEVKKILIVGQKFKPTVIIQPSQAMQELQYTSSNVNIATVDNDGTVTAVSPGEADIRYESYDNKYAVLHVNVYAPTNSIELETKTLELTRSYSFKLGYTIYPADARQEVKIISDNEQVATVKGDTILAVGIGTANITVSSLDNANVTATCLVNVVGIKVDSIALDKTSLKLPTGRTVKINAIVFPSVADNKNLKWTSDNEQVVTVENGTITTVGVGTANVKASATDGSGVTAVCTVVVIANVDNYVSELNHKLSYAQKLYDTSREGTEPGNYPKGSRDALLNVITEVKDRISETMTKKEVLDCYDKLQTAIDEFEAKNIEYNTVYLVLNSGKTVEFTLTEKTTTEFTSTTITFGNVEYEKSDVDYIFYWHNVSTTDIDEVRGSESDNKVMFHVTNDGITADGLAKGEVVNVYTLDGQLVCTGRADSDGSSVSLRLDSLRKQVYIVKTSSGISYKFIKR